MSDSRYRKRALLVVLALFLIFAVMLDSPSGPDKIIIFALYMYYGLIAIGLALWRNTTVASDLLEETH
jgi:hypothetical protein